LTYANDLEVRDGLGWTSLMTAVHRGSKANVQLLLVHGAKIDCDYVHGMHLLATAMTFHDHGRNIIIGYVLFVFVRLLSDDV
jgi:ankyrin repeat protein